MLLLMFSTGMYEGDPYGDEVEGGEDRNDGLNALVRTDSSVFNNDLELTIRYRVQQGHRSGSPQPHIQRETCKKTPTPPSYL